MDRPAVRAATSGRGADSLSTYCYEEVARGAYLLEVYECHARNESRLFDDLNARAGRTGGVECLPAGGRDARARTTSGTGGGGSEG